MTHTTPVDTILDALRATTGEPRGSAGKWTARCPAHHDRQASLSIGTNTDGTVLLHCHAGCDYQTVLAALHVDTKDLRVDQTPNGQRHNQHQGDETIYDYVDETGQLLFQVVRRPDKRFAQRHRTTNGWQWGIAGIRRVPYRLPQIIDAIANGEPVWIVEGEKDVHSIEAAGAVGTCNPGGAGKWRPEYTPPFTDARVIIVADRDQPGRTHAQQVLDQLATVTRHASIVEPLAGKDITDHLNAGHTLDELVPEPPPSRFVAGGTFILDQPDGIPAVWGHEEHVLWAEGESLEIVGPTGVGKTTLITNLILSRISIGPSGILGYPVVPTSNRVLYLAADRPRQIARAFRRLVTETDRDQLDRYLTVHPGPPPGDFAKNTSLLLELAEETEADTVVIDSLKDVALGLSDDEVGAGLNQAIQRALAAGIEVCALHHQRKGQGGTKPKALEDVYGSTWITAGAGSVIILWGASTGLDVELSHLKAPAAPVGPLDLEHDPDAGTFTVARGPADPWVIMQRSSHGLTTSELVRIDGLEPTKRNLLRARRKLDRLVTRGQAVKRDGAVRGDPARYYPIAPEPSMIDPDEEIF